MGIILRGARVLLGAWAGVLLTLGGASGNEAWADLNIAGFGLLGVGTITTNDWIGDGRDRWRTGTYSASAMLGRGAWTGKRPSRAGELLELRFQAEIIGPARLGKPSEEDRPYAGLLHFGAHTYFDRGPWEIRAGTDLVLVGPMTRLDDIHGFIHKRSGGPPPPPPEDQLPNMAFLTSSVEVGRSFAIAGALRARPFMDFQIGHESFARGGLDVTFGGLGKSGVMRRDGTTGTLFPLVADLEPSGLSVLIGADVAGIGHSALLPRERGYVANRLRSRMRAAVGYDSKFVSAFFGVSRLGPEFAAQDEGQSVGWVSASFRF